MQTGNRKLSLALKWQIQLRRKQTTTKGMATDAVHMDRVARFLTKYFHTMAVDSTATIISAVTGLLSLYDRSSHHRCDVPPELWSVIGRCLDGRSMWAMWG